MKGSVLASMVCVALAAPAGLNAREAPDSGGYARDAITVSTPGRHATSAATAACVIWENAEGLGVGPAQLGGLHGLSLTINVKPLAADTSPPTTFEKGLADVRAANPGAPAWMFAALQRNHDAIVRACGEDHPDPVVIQKLTAKDKAG